MIKIILKKICRWVFYLIVFILVITALVSISQDNQRGYRVVNKYTEYLQYQELIGDIIYTREYNVTHVIYRD